MNKISPREYAIKKGITRGSVYKWIKSGKIPKEAISIEMKPVMKIDWELTKDLEPEK